MFWIFCCVQCQGTQVKDVIIKPDAPNTLLLDKHADYIAAYGSKKDDYVSKGFFSTVDTSVHLLSCTLGLLPLFELGEKT